jgi:glycine/D-amino acid oxidase-like deaminating enzyme
MDLKSGYPYWALRTGLAATFPPLESDRRCDVAVIGAGISGALIARELAQHGHEVLVLERRDVGWGSTAASTAILQYEIDTHLRDLAQRHGEQAGVLAYRACADAIPMLEDIATDLGRCDFARNESLYFASRARDTGTLQDERALRARHGFEVEWLDAGALRERYGFDAHGAILSRLGARLDPYRFTLRLLAQLRRQGVCIHDRACVTAMRNQARGVELGLSNGVRVRAGHVVIAAGYEAQRWLPVRVARNRSSYACVGDPLPADRLGELANTLVWESARPYFYLRATADRRLMLGGEDDAIDIPARRDVAVASKAWKLRQRLATLWPERVTEIAFAWAGTFAETPDGLPWFGAHTATGPRVLFAMAYGGNGITFSAAGAPLLRALIERRAHPLKRLFGFSRLERL